MNKTFEKLTKLAEERSAKLSLPDRVPYPQLPSIGALNQEQQWISIKWSIDSAEKHGKSALIGLALTFGRIIQAKYLETLVMDARMRSQGVSDMSIMLWESDVPLTAKAEKIDDLLLPDTLAGPVSFTESILISAPWERFRLFRALENLGKYNWRQDRNHYAVIWYPWPIIWVTNGYHSTSVAAMYGKGTLCDLPCYDAKKLLSAVKPDGQNWLRTYDNSVIETIYSLPMAAIFEIGRRLIALDEPPAESPNSEPHSPM